MPTEFSQIPGLAKWLVIIVFPTVYLWLTAKPYWSRFVDRHYDRLVANATKRGKKPGSRKVVGEIWNVLFHLALVVVAVILWSIYHWMRWLSGVIF